MSSRLDDLTRHIAENYLVQVQNQVGQMGVDELKALHPHLRRIYRSVAYESISRGLVAFRLLDGAPAPLSRQDAIRLHEFDEIAMHNKGSLTLEVVSEVEIYLWTTILDLRTTGPGVLGYSFASGEGEQFWLSGKPIGTRALAKYPLFGLRAFYGVEEALRKYARDVAYGCECNILQTVWREPERLALAPRPESRIRDSLYQFLRNVLADGVPDVNRESPVDDRNPVDIKVTWADSNRIALIEVKWLGSSARNWSKFTRTWREDRAVKGLRQIANYVDMTRSRARRFDTRGFLVIFDGRRAGLRPETTTLTRSQGMYYEYAEPGYEPSILERHDIAPPIRCFCAPNWSVGSPSRGTYVA